MAVSGLLAAAKSRTSRLYVNVQVDARVGSCDQLCFPKRRTVSVSDDEFAPVSHYLVIMFIPDLG